MTTPAMRRKFQMPCRRLIRRELCLRTVALGLPIPRQQHVQLIDLCPSRDDALENIGQIVPRVDVLQLCRVDERRENGPCLRAAFRAGVIVPGF